MKILKLTLIFVFFIIYTGKAQNDFHWKVGHNGSWNDTNSWQEGEVPDTNDIAIFESVGTIDVIIGDVVFLADTVAFLYISNNSHITFLSHNAAFTGTLGVTDYFELSDNSSVHLLSGSANAVFLLIKGTADVYGTVEIDNESIFGPFDDGGFADPLIYFKTGSIFKAGANLTSLVVFNNLQETVFFENGSTYEHRGGLSPFAGSGDVVSFAPESNYEVYTDDVSNLIFSGKTYGNIFVYTLVDITILSGATTFSVFTFNNLITVNAGFSFIGTLDDAVYITGNLINASGGDINITAGDYITFSNINGEPVYLQGINNINFSLSDNADFIFIESGTELILETDINIGVIPGSTANYTVKGIIDCDTFTIIQSINANFTLESGSVLKTANSGGVSGSISNIEIMPEAKIVYNGAEDQVTGLMDMSYYIYINEIEINNNNTVILDNEVEVKSLILNLGNFHINDQTLIITGNINYNEGNLLGDSNNSRLEIIETDADINGFILKTPLSLSDLVLAITGDILLEYDNNGGEDMLLINDSLELNSGKLNINNSNLRLGDNIVISSANYEISYIIAENEGVVKKVFSFDAASSVIIPVGTTHFFSGVSIIPDAYNSEYYINVFEYVYANGWDGEQYTSDMLNMTWNINAENSTDSKAVLEIYWQAGSSIEMPGFNKDNAFISWFDEQTQTWENQPALSIPLTGTVAPLAGISRTIENNGLYCVASSVINNAPIVADQEFRIEKHLLNETVAGKLIATDPDEGQTLSFYVQENHTNPDAFNFYEDGTVTVKNSELLEYSINRLFEYTIDVCDDGIPQMCSQFNLKIYLSEVLDNILISNYISPNNDNHNDTWIIKGVDLARIDVFIFNNSGNLVYESKGYRNDWDGTSKGSRLPAGVYYYIVKTEHSEDKGTITLVR